MPSLPIFVDVKAARALVVGAGAVACGRAKLLKQAGAILRVVAPQLNSDIKDYLDHIDELHLRGFQFTDLEGVAYVIAATNDRTLNQSIGEAAKALGILVNVVDQPKAGNLLFPAVLDRSPVRVAVCSDGASPVLVRRLRAMLETMVPGRFGDLAKLMGQFRERVKSALPNVSERRGFWENVLDSAIAQQVFAGQFPQAVKQLESQVADLSIRHSVDTQRIGEVYLVGAGPGDPDLLTFRALRLLQLADVVLYDRLVSEPILAMARRDAKMIYVGKKKSDHAVPQDQINQKLLEFALAGLRVCRLKGGDPFVFGRGGEEIALLAEHRVPFQVVPGISAANGCSAYAGIPLTHRDYAQSVTFVTGHLRQGAVDLDWKSLVQPRQTLVIYMGLSGVREISRALIKAGMSAQMPAALIEKGTTAEQHVITAPLINFPDSVEDANVHAPTLMIIGEVVKCRAQLAWYEPERNSATDVE